MKNTLTLLVLSLLAISVIPGVLAASVGSGVTPNINVEQFKPLVWMCDSRVVYDDATEPGRISGDGQQLVERINNYAFEGEAIHWIVLVMDKNKIDQNIDVYATVGSTQGEGNDIQVNCQRIGCQQRLMASCNARIQEESITTCDNDIMDMFECTLTVETSDSMYGEYWITVEAQDGDGNLGTMAENEYWYLNPVIALKTEGDLTFDTVRPGATAYSSTMLIGNEADAGSGVMMDMFISGTDFYDSASSGARCPTTNQLQLSKFRYFATSGAYSTLADAQVGRQPGATGQPARNRDAEGYVNIGYGIGFNNPAPFYRGFEILQAQPIGPYWVANVLAPGAEMALTFKLDMPEPCNGNFDTGSIYFWGEAI